MDTALVSVVWAKDRLIAAGRAGGVYVSPDGIAWTRADIDTTAKLLSLVWTGAQLAAVGQLGAVYTSTDGDTWALRERLASGDLHAVAWSGSQFVAVGDLGAILSSHDDAVNGISAPFRRGSGKSLRVASAKVYFTVPATVPKKDLRAAVYSMQGERMIERRDGFPGNEYSVPADRLRTGIYFMELSAPGYRTVEPFGVLR
jgi:hypothetical protein